MRNSSFGARFVEFQQTAKDLLAIGLFFDDELLTELLTADVPDIGETTRFEFHNVAVEIPLAAAR